MLSVLVFSAAIVLPWLLGGTVEPESSTVDVGQGKQRSLLLLIHDTDNTLTAAVAVHTDTRTLSVKAVGYPSHTEVSYQAGLSTLARRYAEEGVAAGQYLSAATGEAYDAVLRLSVSAVAAFVAGSGNGISYRLPEEVGILPQGEQTLTSLQIADVLRYNAWMQSLTGRAEAHAGIIAAIINRHLTPHRELSELFNRFAILCDDHVTISQFAAVRDELTALAAANNGAICRACVPEGRAVGYGEDRRFVIIA
ncbi:MAG: hypothetical protein J6K62_00055 [Clostridia bacterium]|nr:hypothetical protein [Clostridia bacterium]